MKSLKKILPHIKTPTNFNTINSYEQPTKNLTAISVKDLTYKTSHRQILNRVNLTLNYGELVGIIGPNGCGKSTIINLLAGNNSYHDFSGEILINNLAVNKLLPIEAARLRSVVAQNSVMNFNFTAKEVINMGRYPWGKEVNYITKQKMSKAIEFAKVTNLLDRPYKILSGGEQQRVNFARAIAQDTPIMLLDEPTSAMDISHQEFLMEKLQFMAHYENRAVLTVLHDLSLAAAYCDRIIIVSQGSTMYQGIPQQVLNSENLSKIYEFPIKVVNNSDNSGLLIFPDRYYD